MILELLPLLAALALALGGYWLDRRMLDRAQAQLWDRRFRHWASLHQRLKPGSGDVCSCPDCEEVRRQLGLPESWRWVKTSLPKRWS